MPSVTRRSTSSREARRADVLRRLLAVVERLLDEGETFTEISVERMVSEARMSRSTFYVYFADKGDLLRAWFTDIGAEVAQAASQWWAIDADATREDLRDALAHAAAVYRPHTPLTAATFDAAAYDHSLRELTTALIDANIDALRRHIAAGQKAGFVDESLAAAEVATWLIWLAERGFHVIMRDAGEAAMSRHVDAYTAIVWNTLYAPARRA